MNTVNTTSADTLQPVQALSGFSPDNHNETGPVSWAAILAGVTVVAAVSFIFLMLGAGLGLSSVSPWVHTGVGMATLGVSTILWLTFTHLTASGAGGYFVGRLRTKRVIAPTSEVYFLDTAHGFLVWAIAALALSVLLTSAIETIVSDGLQAGASVAEGLASNATDAIAAGAAAGGSNSAKSNNDIGGVDYFVDSLFRTDDSSDSAADNAELGGSKASTDSQQTKAVTVDSVSEIATIFIHALGTETLPPDDAKYIGQIVARRTGLTQQEAEKRVLDTYAHLQASIGDVKNSAIVATDKVRKASAYAALWLFMSLIIGAFVASLAATYGGRVRDS